MEYITIALAKGRLASFGAKLLKKIGLKCDGLCGESRKLIFSDEENKIKFILVKAPDVPTYVEYGVADIGIVGKDTLLEERKNLYEVLDLGFGKCKIAVAGPLELKDNLDFLNNKRIATKYPRVAQDYFHIQKAQTVEIIKLNGSVELAPLIGLSEAIVDIVESGKTLEENGLAVLEDICEISARLVVNKISMKTEKSRVMDIINKVREIIEHEDISCY